MSPMYSDILAPVSAMHICVKKAIVRIRKFPQGWIWLSRCFPHTLKAYFSGKRISSLTYICVRAYPRYEENPRLIPQPRTINKTKRDVNKRKVFRETVHYGKISNFLEFRSAAKGSTPPPARVLASKKKRKSSYKVCNNEKKSISRLRLRLLRHLDSIVPDKDIAEQLRVLRVIGKPDALGKWHRTKIAGLISANYSPQSETRLRLLISELIADLSEKLGGAA